MEDFERREVSEWLKLKPLSIATVGEVVDSVSTICKSFHDHDAVEMIIPKCTKTVSKSMYSIGIALAEKFGVALLYRMTTTNLLVVGTASSSELYVKVLDYLLKAYDKFWKEFRSSHKDDVNVLRNVFLSKFVSEIVTTNNVPMSPDVLAYVKGLDTVDNRILSDLSLSIPVSQGDEAFI